MRRRARPNVRNVSGESDQGVDQIFRGKDFTEGKWEIISER